MLIDVAHRRRFRPAQGMAEGIVAAASLHAPEFSRVEAALRFPDAAQRSDNNGMEDRTGDAGHRSSLVDGHATSAYGELARRALAFPPMGSGAEGVRSLPKVVFQDFDEFADALNGVAGRFAPTARCEADWWVQVAPVGCVTIQQVQTGGPTAFVGDGKDQFITIGVPTTTPGHIHVDGRSLNGNGFILVNQNQPFAIGAQRPTRWAGISIPIEHPCLPVQFLHSTSRYSRAGGRTHQQAALRYVSMTKTLVRCLLSNEHRIQSFGNAATRAAEEELLSVASRVLEAAAGANHVQAGRPAYSRSSVLARALELIEASHGRALFLQDICQAAQVSERTLRNIFHEYFGVGPMRLLKIIRLRDVRAELLAADPHERVWKVANRFGIWDLSMFAHDYKALFGETPHETLRSAPTRSRDNAVNASWVRYASRKLIAASAQNACMKEADSG